MSFEHFCGAEAWEMPAVWEQHCYDSVLAGKAVSAEDHRLAVNTGDLPRVPRLLLPHRPGPGGLPFRAQSGLDPIHYVTLPGAAWDAMLRARETPIHLITNEQAYVPALRSSQTTPSWARRTTTPRSPSAGSRTTHAQRPL